MTYNVLSVTLSNQPTYRQFLASIPKVVWFLDLPNHQLLLTINACDITVQKHLFDYKTSL